MCYFIYVKKFIFSLIISSITILSYTLNLGEELELKTLDFKFLLKKNNFTKNVLLVEIGDKDIEILGKWPWERKYHALLIYALSKLKPRVIYYDVLFTEKSKNISNDKYLAKSIRESGNVFLPALFYLRKSRKENVSKNLLAEKLFEKWKIKNIYTKKSSFLNIPMLIPPVMNISYSSKKIGIFITTPDKDGVLRRVPLLFKFKGNIYPTLILQILMEYFNINADKISIYDNFIKLGNKIKIPVNKNGEFLINYYSDIKNIKSYFFVNILNKFVSRKEDFNILDFKNKIVLIGITAIGMTDFKVIPTSNSVPSINVLANIIDNIIKKDFIMIKDKLTNSFFIFFISFLISILFKKSKPLKSTLYSVSILLFYFILNISLFLKFNIYLNLVYPLLSGILTYIFINLYYYIESEREKEILTELDRLKNDFVSSITHELRSPLANIKNYLNSLIKGRFGNLEPEFRNILKVILNNTMRLSKFIDNVLDFSKIEAGMFKLEKQKIYILEIIEEVILFFEERAREKNITIDIKISEEDITIEADPDKLKQIFINLIDNSLKFTPENGKIKIEERKRGDFIEISVTDTGMGIPEEDIKNIFNRFYQAKHQGKIQYKGTGIGLAITKSLVELHGGNIWVESKLNKGSKFTFTIPKSG